MKKAKILASRITQLLIELGQSFVVTHQDGCICVITELKDVGQISSFMFFKNKTVITLIGQDSIDVEFKLKDLQIKDDSIKHLATCYHGR